MKIFYSIVLSLFFSLPSFAGLISEEGQYSFFGGDAKIKIYEAKGKLNYRITYQSTTGGPAIPDIDPEKDWFIYPENKNVYWIYYGEGTLKKLEIKPNGVKSSSSTIVKNLFYEAPVPVIKEIKKQKE
ncbi:MAG: hypothetical protein AAF984_08450 [Verrucomicrobiota bacterium]